jgi:hypothetical protein
MPPRNRTPPPRRFESVPVGRIEHCANHLEGAELVGQISL